ncbi:MAG TPA: extracellular solute-binding protein [Candidatus Binatia bacterium]|nr:extracellular solute-binding protein [Candidatus Binatia bacterium]
MKKNILSAAVAAVVAVLASSGAVPAANAQGDPYPKAAAALYEKAKQEGVLVVYTVWDVEHIVSILDAFSKRFPGIKTSYWQGRNPEIVQRTVTEFQAGKESVDIILSDNAPPVIRAAGAIQPYETVQDKFLVLHDPTMPIVSLQIQALVYNTKKTKPGDLPKSWEDVANPKYKGNVALDDPMRAGPLSSQLAGLKEMWKDDARFAKFVKGLKALGVPVHKSTSAMFRLVVSGEFSICEPALLHDAMEERDEKHSPVQIVKSAPPVIFPRYGAIYAKAPHPNAAKLLAEWLITTEGQQALDKVGREASRKGFESKTSIEHAYGKGTKPIPVNDKGFMEDPKKWLDTNVKPLWEG